MATIIHFVLDTNIEEWSYGNWFFIRLARARFAIVGVIEHTCVDWWDSIAIFHSVSFWLVFYGVTSVGEDRWGNICLGPVTYLLVLDVDARNVPLNIIDVCPEPFAGIGYE